ncbi:20859_t:CDS:1, partial [Dentiscutata erythropus]
IPIKQYYKGSNDAFFTFSSTAALIYFIHHKIIERDLEIINLDVDNRWDKFLDSPVAKPILRSVDFIRTVWKWFYIEIPSVIHDYRTYKGERVDVNILRSFFSLIMVLICLIITIPTVILACIVLYIPLVIRMVNKIWKKHLVYISLENIFYAIITLVFLTLITIISPVIVLVGEVAVVICVLMISLLEVWCVGILSIKAGFEMIEWILICVIGYSWNIFL